MALDPDIVKARLERGLLSFPVTPFNAADAFDEDRLRELVASLGRHRPSALFAAGGTGEFFSLTAAEHRAVIAATVAEVGGTAPVIAGVGYGAALAVEFARAAESAGADGLLVLPPYLLVAEQEGLYRHVAAICRSVAIGVIIYNRDNSIFAAETVLRLAEACPNLIGFKDGAGNIEQIVEIRQRCGDRLAYIGGMPTAEIFAVPYKAMGIPTYSSAVFNFAPQLALDFYAAVRDDDTATTDRLLRAFFLPYIAIRNRRRGYAVSIVKAGLRAVGRDCGPVRAPLVDLGRREADELAALLETVAGLNRPSPARGAA